MSRSGEFISDGKNGLIRGTAEEILEELTIRIKWEKEKYEDKIKYLEKQIVELEDPYYKDNEIKRLTKERNEAREDLYRGFPISKEENNKINEWIDKHTKEKHGGNHYAGAIGGRYKYIFWPCSLGVIGKIQCSCGEEFEFQNDL